MKRAVLRSVGCALISLAFLAVALPATAQQTASSSTAVAKPAAKAAKPAAKPAAHWAPRYYRWRRPTHWSRYSRWGWHSRWQKPAVNTKPGAKPAVALSGKAAAKPASATSAKPAATAQGKPQAAAHAATQSSVKPAAKPVYWAKPASAAKPKTWVKPAAKPTAWSKPAAWTKPIQKAAAKPAAKTAIKPATAAAAPKPKPAVNSAPKVSAATAHHTQASPENMTRDANNGSQVVGADAPIAGGDRVDIMGQIGRMVGALLVVLLIIVFLFYVLRRYKLVPLAEAGAALPAAPPAPSSAGKGLVASIMPALSSFAQSRGQRISPQAPSQEIGADLIGNGGLQIVGAQPLPGSGTIIYLVRIEDHMVLLGASYAGGVRLLAEWEKDEPAEEKESKQSFESLLREQAVAPEAARADEEEHTFATIRARLNSTADRLAGLRAEFGG